MIPPNMLIMHSLSLKGQHRMPWNTDAF